MEIPSILVAEDDPDTRELLEIVLYLLFFIGPRIPKRELTAKQNID
jgi:hypothetical protein